MINMGGRDVVAGGDVVAGEDVKDFNYNCYLSYYMHYYLYLLSF